MSTKLYILFESTGYRMIATSDRMLKSKKEDRRKTFDSFFSFKSNFNQELLDINGFDLINSIEMLEEKIDTKINEIIVVDQNTDSYIKNIECIQGSKEKDIKKLVKFDYEQNYSIEFSKYVLSLKKMKNENGFDNMTSILYPKSMIDIFEKINRLKRIKITHIYMYFDLILNYIYEKFEEVNFQDETFIYMYCRNEDVVLSIVDKGILINSMVVKHSEIDVNIINFLNSYEKVYVFKNVNSNIIDSIYEYGEVYEVDIFEDILINLRKNKQSLINGNFKDTEIQTEKKERNYNSKKYLLRNIKNILNKHSVNNVLDIVKTIDNSDYIYKSLAKLWVVVLIFFITLSVNKYRGIVNEIENEKMKYGDSRSELLVEDNSKKNIKIDNVVSELEFLKENINTLEYESENCEIEVLVHDLSKVNDYVSKYNKFRIKSIEKQKIKEQSAESGVKVIDNLKKEISTLTSDKNRLEEEIKNIQNSFETAQENGQDSLNKNINNLRLTEEKIIKKKMELENLIKNEEKSKKIDKNEKYIVRLTNKKINKE